MAAPPTPRDQRPAGGTAGITTYEALRTAENLAVRGLLHASREPAGWNRRRRERSGRRRRRAEGPARLAERRGPSGPALNPNRNPFTRSAPHNVVLRLMRYTVASLDA